MQDAQKMLFSPSNTPPARPEAKKIVVFISDGEPVSNTPGKSNQQVGQKAVKVAQDITAAGGQVFSIGILPGNYSYNWIYDIASTNNNYASANSESDR
jgi:Mg-chelatase subunit ChlD